MTHLHLTADRYTALRTLEPAFIPLPGIHQVVSLTLPEEVLPDENDCPAMDAYGDTFVLIDLLVPYGVRDVTPDTPWCVTGFRCAWESKEKGVSTGWRRLRLPGLSAYTYHDDTQAPLLHLSPDGGVIYEPGPHVLDPTAPRWLVVESLPQLLDLMARISPLKGDALEPPGGH
ncbi:hypothetical protein [Vreelandella massiliensis]|uniref:hypothetical protein n=1 Tax=Vreelandella massiliensis TaxID=1816686 RepID=UPI00096AAF8F|nr:hypothetical protein [Halomonas massiliensis]